MSSKIDLTYTSSSLLGFVSSYLKFVDPPYCLALSKSVMMARACPMCKNPLGSGGNRVIISLCLPDSKSDSIIVVIKFDILSMICHLIVSFII